jgi:uncharacterized protein YdhG (YjbR/CyaY superfamily)
MSGTGSPPSRTEESREVDAWFDRLPPDQREALQALRQRIRELVPEAGERISYRVPTFVLEGPLVALNASKSGLSLITMRPDLLASLRGALGGVSWSGSTLRFQPDRPLPDDVLREVIEARVEQNRRGE